MTANELIKHFNESFGFNSWPETFEVDAETYAYCCQHIFEAKLKHGDTVMYNEDGHELFEVGVFIGINHGLYFKGVELRMRQT